MYSKTNRKPDLLDIGIVMTKCHASLTCSTATGNVRQKNHQAPPSAKSCLPSHELQEYAPGSPTTIGHAELDTMSSLAPGVGTAMAARNAISPSSLPTFLRGCDTQEVMSRISP